MVKNSKISKLLQILEEVKSEVKKEVKKERVGKHSFTQHDSS